MAGGPENYEFGQNSYSDPENDDAGFGCFPDREIIGGRFGNTQNAAEPDYMPYGLHNWAGVSQVQEHVEDAGRPPWQVQGSHNAPAVGQDEV